MADINPDAFSGLLRVQLLSEDIKQLQIARDHERSRAELAELRLEKLKQAIINIKALPIKSALPYSDREFEERAYNEALWEAEEIADAALAAVEER